MKALQRALERGSGAATDTERSEHEASASSWEDEDSDCAHDSANRRYGTRRQQKAAEPAAAAPVAMEASEEPRLAASSDAATSAQTAAPPVAASAPGHARPGAVPPVATTAATAACADGGCSQKRGRSHLAEGQGSLRPWGTIENAPAVNCTPENNSDDAVRPSDSYFLEDAPCVAGGPFINMLGLLIDVLRLADQWGERIIDRKT